MSKSADAFRTISEVADWLGVQTHVLRFWESKFTQVKPVKRAGGRRYYRPADMLLLGGIRKLLHEDGLTIKGVQKILREEGMAHVADMSPPLDAETADQLDGDLVTNLPDESEQAAAALMDATDPGDAGPFADTHPIRDDTPAPAAVTKPSTVPSFMRSDAADLLANAEPVERAPDVPDLNSDFKPTQPAPLPETTQTPSYGQDAPQNMQDDAGPFATDDAPAEAPSPEPFFQDFDAAADDSAPPVQDEPEIADAAPDSPFPDPDPTLPDDEAAQAAEDETTLPPVDPAPMFQAYAPENVPQPQPAGEAEPAPVAAFTPRPRVLDIPDEADTGNDDITPSVLTRATRINRLTPAQANALRPLVAQLTALRDQMARSRRDPR